MLTSADAVAKRMRQVAEAAQKGQLVAVSRAAFAMKAAHTAGLLADAPGGRLRNVGKKAGGAKLSVRYKIKGGAADPSAIVEAVGPWQILNNPASPHLIVAKKGTALRLPNGYRRAVQHPGHQGKRTWQKARPEAEKVGERELNRSMTRTVQQAFKG